MSTKIFNGYRYRNPNGHRADPFKLADQIRAAVGEVVTAAYITRVAQVAADIHDGIGPADPAPLRERFPLIDAERHLAQAAAQISATRLRDSDNDFSCEVAVLPDPADPSALLLLVFCEQPVAAAMATIDGVEEYVYFDNTDRPDAITEQRWEQRRATWERVLGGDAPASRGLICELPDLRFTALLDHRHELEAALPDRHSRARRIAAHRAADGVHVETLGALAALIDETLADTAKIDAIAAELDDLTFDDLIGPVTVTR